MVKLRMNTADVAAEVRCLRKLIGMRCANIYDLSPKVSSETLRQSLVYPIFIDSVFCMVELDPPLMTQT